MFDFDQIIDRRNTCSEKWNVKEGELPVWVADMDFQTAPAIIEALQSRVEHGIFGYSCIPDTWRQAIIGWWKDRHSFLMEKEWLLFSTGVIPVITTAVRTFAKPGENVVILSPVYNHFYISIEDHGRIALESRLQYENGSYVIAWADLESKLSDPKTAILLLSNPHNPTGNIWDKETLARIGKLAAKHNVLVISDEIHCDLTDPGWEYTPYASVSEICAQNSISCIAPTKAFNIAGLHSAAAVVPDKKVREKLRTALSAVDAAMPNAFAVTAAEAAFTKGEPWLDSLRQYIAENKDIVRTYIAENLPEVKVVPSHATYLIWLDFSAVTKDGRELCRWIREKTGLFMNMGDIYRGNGLQFARFNAACPKAVIADAMERLQEGIKTYQERI